MELPRIERESDRPDKLSSKAIRFLLGELAVYEGASEKERVEMMVARMEFELKLRQGQGH